MSRASLVSEDTYVFRKWLIEGGASFHECVYLQPSKLSEVLWNPVLLTHAMSQKIPRVSLYIQRITLLRIRSSRLVLSRWSSRPMSHAHHCRNFASYLEMRNKQCQKGSSSVFISHCIGWCSQKKISSNASLSLRS